MMRRKMLWLLLLFVVLLERCAGNGQLVVWAAGKTLDIFAVATAEQRFAMLAGLARIVCCMSIMNAMQNAKERMETTPEDRWRLSVHEAGHALALIARESESTHDDDYLRESWWSYKSWFTPTAKPLEEKTRSSPRFELRGIELRLGASSMEPAGVTPFRFRRKQVAFEGRDVETMLHLALAGRAAEEAVLGRGSAGAAGDFEVARHLARVYVQLSFGDRFDANVPPREVDRRARRMLRKAHSQAFAFAKLNRQALTNLARELFVSEKLTAKRARSVVAASSKDTAAKKKTFAFNFPQDPRRCPTVDRKRFFLVEGHHLFSALFSRVFTWLTLAEYLDIKADDARLAEIKDAKQKDSLAHKKLALPAETTNKGPFWQKNNNQPQPSPTTKKMAPLPLACTTIMAGRHKHL